MAKRTSAAARMTDKELVRRIFSKSVRKELKAVLAKLDPTKPKKKSAKKR